MFARECCQYLLDNYRLADPTDPPTYGDLKKLGASPGNSLRFSACVPNRQRPQTTPKSQASRRSGAADGSVYRFCAHPLPPDFPSMLHIQNVEFSHPILFDMSLPPRRVPPPRDARQLAHDSHDGAAPVDSAEDRKIPDDVCEAWSHSVALCALRGHHTPARLVGRAGRPLGRLARLPARLPARWSPGPKAEPD